MAVGRCAPGCQQRCRRHRRGGAGPRPCARWAGRRPRLAHRDAARRAPADQPAVPRRRDRARAIADTDRPLPGHRTRRSPPAAEPEVDMALVLYAIAGNDAQWRFPVTEADGTAKDLSGATDLVFLVKRRVDDDDEDAVVTATPTVADAAGGILEVRLTPADTAALARRRLRLGHPVHRRHRRALGVPRSIAGTGSLPRARLGRGHGADAMSEVPHATPAHLRREGARWHALRQPDGGPLLPAPRGQLRRVVRAPHRAPPRLRQPSLAQAPTRRSSMTGSASTAGPVPAGAGQRIRPPASRSTTSSRWWLAARPTSGPTCGRSVRAATPASRSMTAMSGAEGVGRAQNGRVSVSRPAHDHTRGRVSPFSVGSPTGATGRPRGAMGIGVVRWAIPGSCGLPPPAGLASRGAPGPTRRAHGRPSGAARPRWRAAAGAARCALRELQRAQGVEPAAAVMGRPWVVRCAILRRQRAARTGRLLTRKSPTFAETTG